MGLMKTLHTKLGERTYITADEKRAGGLSPKKKQVAKKLPPPTPLSNSEYITDMLDGLL